MFPNIDTGHVIVIDGAKYLAVLRLPDAFVLRGLVSGDDRVIVFDFEELAKLYDQGLLLVEGPLKPEVPASTAYDGVGRPMFEAFLHLEGLGLAERSDEGIRKVMPILLEFRSRHSAGARCEAPDGSEATRIAPSPAEFRDFLGAFVLEEGLAGRNVAVPTMDFPRFDPRVALIANELTVDRLTGRKSINEAFVDDLCREAVGLVERPTDGTAHTPIADLITEVAESYAREREVRTDTSD